MSNEELVYNIRPTVAGSEVTGYGGGCRQINLEASTKRFGTVKFDPEGVYNLLKFSSIADLHTVYWNQATKSSDERHNFLVVCDDGASYRFNALSNGMFVCQVDTDDYVSPDNDLILTTVGEKKRKYSQKQVRKADEAVALQERLGWASTSDALKMLKYNSFASRLIICRLHPCERHLWS